MHRRRLSIALSAMLAISAVAHAQSDSSRSAEPVSITIGDGPRMFSTETARGSLVALHLIPAASSDDIGKHLKLNAAQFATIAGLRHAIVVGGSPENFAAAITGTPPDLHASLFHDVSGAASATLGIASLCKSRAADPCHAIVLLSESGTEVYRSAGSLGAFRASFDALRKAVADHTRDKDSEEANLEEGLALQGYDPVSYLDQQRATIGDKRFESAYRGATYRFSSAEHRATFNASPAKYVPAYGGWCATAIASGDKVEVDAKNFKVTNGRLFLFYKGLFGNALNDWNKDEQGLTAKADVQWKKRTKPN